MTEFEEQVLAKLDLIIKIQSGMIDAIFAANGIDLEYEKYKAKFRQIQYNAAMRRNGVKSLEDLGVEVTDD